MEYLFIAEERHRLIDQQIERSASLLVASNLSKAQLSTIEEAEDIVFDVLEEDPPNQIIQLYNEKNELIYANDLAKLIQQEFPSEVGWQTIKEQGHRFRLLTVFLPEKQRTLQVGLVLDRYDNLWRLAHQRIILFGVLIFLVVSILSYFLMKILMSPLSELAKYLTYLGTQVSTTGMISNDSMVQPFLSSSTTNDEFGELVKSVQHLRVELQKSLAANKFLSAQMAHELKTPLTILRNILEKNYHHQKLSEQIYNESIQEITGLEKTISEFLNWSYLETNPLPTEVHAVKVSSFLSQLISSFNEKDIRRIQLKTISDFTVFCKPSLLKQLFLNLLTNSLKYTNDETQIILTVENNRFVIEDSGAGISQDVLKNIGKPFNKGPQVEERGSGLGLAWVSSICSKYNWKLDIQSNDKGTKITINFPADT